MCFKTTSNSDSGEEITNTTTEPTSQKIQVLERKITKLRPQYKYLINFIIHYSSGTLIIQYKIGTTRRLHITRVSSFSNLTDYCNTPFSYPMAVVIQLQLLRRFRSNTPFTHQTWWWQQLCTDIYSLYFLLLRVLGICKVKLSQLWPKI